MDLGTTKMIARKDGGVGWMIFNQPEKHNAMSYEMWQAVPKIIADFEADPDVRVIVLTGAGEKAFVSGADISEFEKKRSAEESIKVYDAAGEAAHSALINAHQAHHRHDPRHLHRRRPGHRAQHRRAHLLGQLGVCRAGGEARPRLQLCRHQAAGRHRRALLRQGDLLLGQQVHCRGRAHHGARQPRGTGGRARELRAQALPPPSAAMRRSPSRRRRWRSTPRCRIPTSAAFGEIDAAIKACFASEDYIEGRRAFMEKRKPAFQGR